MEQGQPPRIERRLAAIVAADVAGYSRLMGLDEVGTARALREHRKVTDALVEKHGGRLVKSTGDGVLLEFPSVVDAVECAVAVQAVMAQRNEGVPVDLQMLFRLGINLGDILIEGDDILVSRDFGYRWILDFCNIICQQRKSRLIRSPRRRGQVTRAAR